MDSRQVGWYEVHLFITELVAAANVGPLPLAGTPSWQALADDDVRKLLSLATAGEHSVLRWETSQQAQAEASKAIAAAEDWPAVARQIHRGRGRAFIPRRREIA